MNNEAHTRLLTENKLKHAIAQDEISVNYQPIVKVSDGSFVGLEALVRWFNPDLGQVSPEYFIPIAESSGIIHDLGHRVFQQAIADVRQLCEHTGKPVRLAINASTLQFQSSQWFDEVRCAIEQGLIAADHLEIEITERLLLDDSSNVNDQLQAFTGLGVQLSVDDFGTGYSALSYLKRCPVSTVKIDRSFIRDTPHDKDDVVLVRAIIAMAHGLGLEVIAEGVETLKQWHFLREEGCDFAQGYFFSKPLKLEKLLQWSQNNGS